MSFQCPRKSCVQRLGLHKGGLGDGDGRTIVGKVQWGTKVIRSMTSKEQRGRERKGRKERRGEEKRQEGRGKEERGERRGGEKKRRGEARDKISPCHKLKAKRQLLSSLSPFVLRGCVPSPLLYLDSELEWQQQEGQSCPLFYL